MRIGITLAAIAILSVTAASSARADGFFFSEGLGTSEIGGELGEHLDANMNVRIAVGWRVGRWAVEGFMMGTMMDGRGLSGGMSDATAQGLSARYMFPVGKRLELYLRGGLHTVQLDVSTGDIWDDGFSGRAFHYGAGAVVKGKVPVLGMLFLPLLFTDIGPKMTGSLWLETGHQFTRLHHDTYDSIDASIKSWTMGFSVGSDF